MNSSVQTLLRFFCVAVFGVLGFAACGPSAPPKEQGVVTGPLVRVEANDLMKFNIRKIQAKPGEELKVTLRNTGQMPKETMGHNIVFLAAGVDLNAFVSASSRAAQNDYVAPEYKDRVLAATKVLGPGQEEMITFKAPSEPGEYHFVCSFPGHTQAGMRGLLVVSP